MHARYSHNPYSKRHIVTEGSPILLKSIIRVANLTYRSALFMVHVTIESNSWAALANPSQLTFEVHQRSMPQSENEVRP